MRSTVRRYRNWLGACVCWAILGCGPRPGAPVSDTGGETAGPVASESANEVAQRALADYRRGLTGGDWEPFFARLDDNIEIRFPMGRFRGEHVGIAAARELFPQVAQDFPGGIEAEGVERVTTDGARVVFEMGSSDKRRGQLYRNRVAIVMEICGGKVCAYREYFGLAGPPPER